jgi:hypothetical protein
MCLPMRPLRRLSATHGMDCRVKPGKGTGAGLRHVGWVERSETHQTPLVGFTALNPPYELPPIGNSKCRVK